MSTAGIIAEHRFIWVPDRWSQPGCSGCDWISEERTSKTDAISVHAAHVAAIIDAQNRSTHTNNGDTFYMRRVVSAARVACKADNEWRELASLGPRPTAQARTADQAARQAWSAMDDLHDTIVRLDTMRAIGKGEK